MVTHGPRPLSVFVHHARVFLGCGRILRQPGGEPLGIAVIAAGTAMGAANNWIDCVVTPADRIAHFIVSLPVFRGGTVCFAKAARAAKLGMVNPAGSIHDVHRWLLTANNAGNVIIGIGGTKIFAHNVPLRYSFAFVGAEAGPESNRGNQLFF